MQRLGEAALLLFVLVMGIDRPAPPLPAHAEWADVAMAIAAAALVLAWRARRAALSTDETIVFAVAAYVGWSALSAAVHGAGGWKALGIAELGAVTLATTVVASRPAARDRLLRAWICGSLVLSAAALLGATLALAGVPSVLYDPRGGDLNLPFRARGLCTTSNLLASQLLTPLVLLATDDHGRWLRRGWRLVALALIALAFASTLSRSWLAALLAGVLLRLRGWPRIVCAGLLLATALASARFDLYRRADGAVIVSAAPGLRWRLASSALHTASEHPLFGVGPAAEPARVDWPRPGDPPAELRAHSTLLDVAATLGLPALAALALLCALVLRRAMRAPPDATRDVLVCALVATIFDGLTVDIENFRHLWLLLGLVAV